MFVTMNRIPIRQGYEDVFAKRFRKRAGLVDQTPGFIRNMVLRPCDEDGCHIVLTLWESKEAFLAWTKSEAFRKAHRKAEDAPKAMFLGPAQLETYEVVCDSG